MNLATILEQSVKSRPTHVALRFGEHEYTYRELDVLVNRRANGLVRAGLKSKERVVLMMQNGLEFVVNYYAIAKVGAALIPVNFLYKRHELSHIFRDSGAHAFIGMAPHLGEARGVLHELPGVRIRLATGIEHDPDFTNLSSVQGDDDFEMVDVEDDAIFTIVYTSGTTGVPKGAMLSHRNLYSNAMTVADMRRISPDDVAIGVLPLYHIYGQTSLLNASIYCGLTIHLFTGFEPGPVISLIENEKSTVLFAVPTMLNRLLLETETRGVARSSLRFCVSGGSSLPMEIMSQFEQRFKTGIYEGYGLSECSPVCVENPFGGKTKLGSIGLPIPGFKAKIVDEKDREVQEGEVGELIVKGPGVMQGYLNLPQETAATVVDGWLHTGDLARVDDEGYIYIVDRKKDMVIRGAYNVYPREIEEILFENPKIVEAAVFGQPDTDLGEEIAAAVVPVANSGITADEIKQFVKERVAPYKYPRIIHLMDELPKSHTGKVLKKELKKRKWV